MATAQDKEAAWSCRESLDLIASGMNHEMRWKLDPNANRRGYAYCFLGWCRNCGAEVMADAGGASCPGDRDARVDRCELVLTTDRRTR